MIVYATNLALKDRASLDQALKEFKSWLNNKIGPSFRSWVLIPNTRPFSTRHDSLVRVSVRVAGSSIEASPYYLSIEFIHLDPNTKGRSWKTEVSFEHGLEDDPRMGVVLSCDDTSVENQSRSIEPTIPSFVKRVEKRGLLSSKGTPGLEIPKLDRSCFDDFQTYLKTDKRSHCVILASPRHNDNRYEVDPETLSKKLLGLGEVWLLPSRFIARSWMKVCDYHFRALDGDVLIILPDRRGSPLCVKFSRETAARLSFERNITFTDYIFRYVISRSNFRLSRKLVTIDEAHRRNSRYRLNQLKEQFVGSSENEELLRLFEEDKQALQKDKDSLELQLMERDDEVQSLKDELYQKEQLANAYLQRLNEKLSADGESLMQINRASPESYQEILDLVRRLMGERLILHNNAEKTLGKCQYSEPLAVWRVFKALYEELYIELNQELKLEGSITRLARIGAEYVPHQSDLTVSRFEGYKRIFNGRTYTLNRHITLGSSRDLKRCFRLYFEYCDKERRIIVFHAGKHLDNTMT